MVNYITIVSSFLYLFYGKDLCGRHTVPLLKYFFISAGKNMEGSGFGKVS
jgi:hypothetical protein